MKSKSPIKKNILKTNISSHFEGIEMVNNHWNTKIIIIIRRRLWGQPGHALPNEEKKPFPHPQ